LETRKREGRKNKPTIPPLERGKGEGEFYRVERKGKEKEKEREGRAKSWNEGKEFGREKILSGPREGKERGGNMHSYSVREKKGGKNGPHPGKKKKKKGGGDMMTLSQGKGETPLCFRQRKERRGGEKEGGIPFMREKGKKKRNPHPTFGG